VSFIGCVILTIIAVVLSVPWEIAVAAGLGIFVIVVATIGRRFKRSLGNDDIAFWMISQRMLPPIAIDILINAAGGNSPAATVVGDRTFFDLSEAAFDHVVRLNDDDTLTERGQLIIEHTPIRRFGEPEGLVCTAVWLASDVARFVTGIAVPVDGGFSASSGI
jgi:NAD(P)-dependent dehydrogenase (short-subunit alcohol dehydrogenase family)